MFLNQSEPKIQKMRAALTVFVAILAFITHSFSLPQSGNDPPPIYYCDSELVRHELLFRLPFITDGVL